MPFHRNGDFYHNISAAGMKCGQLESGCREGCWKAEAGSSGAGGAPFSRDVCKGPGHPEGTLADPGGD